MEYVDYIEEWVRHGNNALIRGDIQSAEDYLYGATQRGKSDPAALRRSAEKVEDLKNRIAAARA